MDERERRPEPEGIDIPPRPPLPSPPPPSDTSASENETVPIDRPARDAAPAAATPSGAAATEPAATPTEPAVTELVDHRPDPAPEPAVTELLSHAAPPPVTEPLAHGAEAGHARSAPAAATPSGTAATERSATPTEPAVTELIDHRPDPAPEPEATTLPLPIVGGAEAAAPAPVAAQPAAEPPAKKRRRGRAVAWTLVAIVVVLAVVGVVGWFAGEAWAEKTVTATVQQQTAKALGLSDSQDVQVGLTDPVLPQVLAGSLKTLDVTVPNAPIGGSTGTVKLHATGVPTNGSGTPTSANASITLSPEALQSLAGAQKDIVPGSVKVVGSNIAVTLNPAQFLSHVSFTLTFAPSVSQGQLVLTPSNFEVAGFDVSAETIKRRFGSLAAGIVAPRTMCVASYFPKGMTLTGIQVSETAVVTDFAVDPRIATDPSLQAKGTCP